MKSLKKNRFKIFVFVFFSQILTTSCDDISFSKEENLNATSSVTLSAFSELINLVDDIHSDGCVNLITNQSRFNNLSDTGYVDSAFTITSKYLDDEFSFQNFTEGDVVHNSKFINLKSQGLFGQNDNIEPEIENMINLLKSSSVNIDLEIDYVENVNQILNYWKLNATNCQSFFENVSNSLDDLYDDYIVDNSNSNAELNGELCAAYIQIAKGSIALWSENSSINWSNEPVSSAFIIVQIDAAGYLIGWGMSWWDDVNSENYSTSWEDQRRRIGDGMLGAIGASTFKYLG